MDLRQATSGGIIHNADRGTLEPGRGMMMRLAEGVTTIGGSLQISTTPQTLGTQLGAGVVLAQSLVNPQPGRYYRASVCIDVTNNNTTNVAEVVLFLDTSVDGAAFVERVFNLHLVNAGSGAAGNVDNGRHCRLDMVLRLGSELGVEEGSQVLQLRSRIALVAAVADCEVDSRAASAGYSGAVGTCLLQLSEHF